MSQDRIYSLEDFFEMADESLRKDIFTLDFEDPSTLELVDSKDTSSERFV